VIFPNAKNFLEEFQFFFIDCEKSKKSEKKLLPQKTADIIILTLKPRLPARISSLAGPKRLQIDKMPEKWRLTGVLRQ